MHDYSLRLAGCSKKRLSQSYNLSKFSFCCSIFVFDDLYFVNLAVIYIYIYIFISPVRQHIHNILSIYGNDKKVKVKI